MGFARVLGLWALLLAGCATLEPGRDSTLPRPSEPLTLESARTGLGPGALSELEIRFRRALRVDPHDAQARDGLAWCLAARGDLLGAAGLYQDWIRREPGNPAARRQMLGAILSLARSDASRRAFWVDKARQELEALRNLDPQAGDLAALDSQIQAVVLLPAAPSWDPRSLEVLARAQTAFRSGQWSRAATLYEELVRRNPHRPDGYLYLGDCHFARQDYVQALAWYRRGLQVDPAHCLLWRCVGQAHEAQGQLLEARDAYRRALDHCPGYGAALADQERLRRRAGGPLE